MNKIIISSFIIITFFSAALITAQKRSLGKILNKSFVSRTTVTERDYLVYFPKGYDQKKDKKWPVLLFLHGNGERGNDVLKVKIHGPLKEIEKGRELPLIIIAPQMLPFPDNFIYKYSPYAWKSNDRQPMLRETTNLDLRWDEYYPPYGWDTLEEDLVYLINKYVNEFNGDVNKVYITGLSYGGYGTWYMLINHPEMFAAGVPVCGAGNPKDVKKIGKVPVWLFHGGRDRVVLPEWSLETADFLDAAGGNVRVTVHEDLGHDCWTRVYSGKDIYDWLLSHER